MKLFVYGTLRRQYAGGMAGFLAANAKHLGTGVVQAKMLDLGGIAGVVQGKGLVHGDVYEILDKDVMDRVDAYEGYPKFYNRMQMKVDTPKQEDEYSAWVYIYAIDDEEYDVIEGGSWLDYI